MNNNTGKIKLGIIFGGRSGEHDVSLMSAASVIKAVDKGRFDIVTIGITRNGEWLLYDGPVEKIETGAWQAEAEAALENDPAKYGLTIIGTGGRSIKEIVDFAFPVLHGPNGEDGTIQGLFEMADIPYAGCGVLGSAAAMDKAVAKDLFEKAGLPICKHVVVFKEDIEYNIETVILRVEAALDYPVFVKPANMGSSVGISKAKNNEGLKEALMEAFKHDRRIVIEEGLDCREIETGILGNYKPEAAAVGEIIPSNEFYDYSAKYFDGGQSRMCVPAGIPEETAELIKKYAIKAYEALECCGFSRVDFFLENRTNRIFLNEINTIPGFTKFSMFPSLWAEAGVRYSELIERIIDFGFKRYEERKKGY
jgi:D-alanine-D-alanine ligase